MTDFRDRTAPVIQVTAQPEGQKEYRLDLSQSVLSLVYEDSDKKADKLTLTVNNWDLQAFDQRTWRKGMLLRATWGYPGDMTPLREAVVHEVKGSQSLSVVAYDKSMVMNKVHKVRTFKNMSRADVVRQIAEENGFGFARVDIEDTGESHDTIVQARQTDSQFMKRLAQLEGFQFYVDFDGLHWHQRRLGQKPIRVLHYYSAPRIGEILDGWTVENDITGRPGMVHVKGRDPLTKKDIHEKGSNADTQRKGTATIVEVVDPDTGDTHFEARAASETTVGTAQQTAAAAKRHADAKYRSSVQGTVKMTLPIIGDPNLIAKTVVELRGMGKRLSGRYYVSDSKHSVDSGGYKGELKVRSDGHHGYGDKSGVASKGKVNTNAATDPNALHPVEVVDPDTGETKIIYRDSRGRAVGDKE